MAAPSIALTSLSIRDFRGLRALDLDFCGPDGNPNQLVVLAGPNGCGKTAVLEAGLLAVGRLQLIAGPTGSSALRKGAERYSIRAGVLTRGMVEEPVIEGPDPKNFRMNEELPAWYFPSWRAAPYIGPVNPTVRGRKRKNPNAEGNRLLIVKQSLVNAATIERFGNGPTANGRYSAILQRINWAWDQFYREKHQSFAVAIVQSDESGDGAFDVRLQVDDGVYLEVDYLSSGQLELFLFISTLALNSDHEGIVFIDEPELHLDPQWHRPILRCLMQLQPRAQIIVATHSPEIYDEAQFYERHFLVPEDDPRAHLWPSVKSVEAGE